MARRSATTPDAYLDERPDDRRAAVAAVRDVVLAVERLTPGRCIEVHEASRGET